MAKLIRCVAAVLCIALLEFPVGVIAEGSTMPRSDREALWQISQTRVMAQGETTVIPEGVLSSGYVLRGKASSNEEGAPFIEGIFQVTLSAFSPTKDMPGQKAGKWYVRGDWTLTDSNADPAARQFRHNPHLISGTLTAELDFNPAETAGELEAKLFQQKSAMRQRRGGVPMGTFSGNQNFEGTLYLPALK